MGIANSTRTRCATWCATTRARLASGASSGRSPKSAARSSPSRPSARRESGPAAITEEDIERYNGVRRFTYGLAEEANQVGVATGLAWTSAGGELLSIEAIAVPGKGRQIKTRFPWRRDAGVHPGRHDVCAQPCRGPRHPRRPPREPRHPHPRPGRRHAQGRRPSAGVGMCTALVSVITGIAVSADIAMTGEITLRGQVLRHRRPEGKAPRRPPRRHPPRHHPEGKRTRPKGNPRQRPRRPDGYARLSWMDEIIDIALERRPTPREDATELPPQQSDGPQPTPDLTLNAQ